MKVFKAFETNYILILRELFLDIFSHFHLIPIRYRGFGNSMQRQKKVYIIILNWNGWRDTIECLESVFRTSYSNYQVIVCDNNSQDDSLEHIKAWAEGQLEIPKARDNPLKNLSSLYIKKPISYVEYDINQSIETRDVIGSKPQIVLIQTGSNLGFAGGNNVGLQYVLAQDDFGYVWLLNNDTVVKPDSLSHMLDRMERSTVAGMCGSTLLYYHKPELVQALGGGTYCKWFAITRHIGAFRRFNELMDTKYVESKINYIVGASILLSRQFLKDIGLMCEDYFLYFEELDWAMRSQGKYTLTYAPKSIVYHKEGATIGRSKISDYFFTRNRIVFTQKYFPYCLTTVYLGLLFTLIKRIYKFQFTKALMVVKIICSKRYRMSLKV